MNIRKVSHFNHDLYRRVRESRRLRGLPVEDLSVELKDHEFIDQKMYSISEECEYTVDRVHKMWHNGWFIIIMAIDSHNSHRTVYWQNINCKDESILEGIDESREDFLFITKDGNYVKEI
jgi:hypothetical protein